jgi:hypothetical protein
MWFLRVACAALLLAMTPGAAAAGIVTVPDGGREARS